MIRRRPAFFLSAAIFAAGLMLSPATGAAQSRDPFARFLGSWRGAGFVVGTDGNRTRIVCRASYAVTDSRESLSQTLTCASDSYRFEITSYVVADGASVQGYWQEATRQVRGNLTGQVAEGDFEGAVSGPGFAASLSLRSSGRKQLVTIDPNGAGGIANVSITLSRQG